MATWLHTSVMDNGLSLIVSNAQRYVLIKAYAAADSYATVTSKIVAAVATTSSDYTLGNQGTNGRQVTVASKNATMTGATTNGVDNLHLAWLDDTNTKVLAVTNETTDRTLAIGDVVTLPQINILMNQPT